MEKNILKIYAKNLSNQNESAKMAVAAGCLFALTSKLSNKEINEQLLIPFKKQYTSDTDWRNHRGQHTRIPNAVRALSAARAEAIRLLIDPSTSDQANIDSIYHYLNENKLSVATINATWTTSGNLKTPRAVFNKKTDKKTDSHESAGTAGDGAIVATTPDYRPMIEKLKDAIVTLNKCSEVDTYRALIDQELAKLGYTRAVHVTRKKAA